LRELARLGLGRTPLAKDPQRRGSSVFDFLLLLIDDTPLQHDFRLTAAQLTQGGRRRRPDILRRICLQNVDERRDAPGIAELAQFSSPIFPAGSMETLELLGSQYHRVKRVQLSRRNGLTVGCRGASRPGDSSRPHPHTRSTHTRTGSGTPSHAETAATTRKKRDRDDRCCRDSKTPGSHWAGAWKERKRPKPSPATPGQSSPAALDGRRSIQCSTGTLNLDLTLKRAWAAVDLNLSIDRAAARAGDLGVPFEHLAMHRGRRGITQPDQPEHDAKP
jgi:hypothetical protein